MFDEWALQFHKVALKAFPSISRIWMILKTSGRFLLMSLILFEIVK